MRRQGIATFALIMSLLALLINMRIMGADETYAPAEPQLLTTDDGRLYAIYNNIVFEGTDRAGRNNGYLSAAETGGRIYSFQCWDIAANARFIHVTEYLIENIVDNFGIGNHAQVRRLFSLTDSDMHPGAALREAHINYSDANHVGVLAYVLGRGFIPYWMAVGIELHLRAENPYFDCASSDIRLYEAMHIDINDFSDVYFTPLYWGMPEQQESISTAHLFVKHLLERDLLDELIHLYLSEDAAGADALAGSHFHDFTGGALNAMFRIEKMDTNLSASADFAVIASTPLANYNFMFSHSHTGAAQAPWRIPQDRDTFPIPYLESDEGRFVDALSMLVCFFDDSIMFTKDWYSDVDYTFSPIDFNIYLFEGKRALNSGFYAGGWVTTHNLRVHLFDPTVSAHEVSHVLTRLASPGVFMPFDEGLATLISKLHDMHDRDNHGLAYGFIYRGYATELRFLRDEIIQEEIHGEIGYPFRYLFINLLLSEFDLVVILHLNAHGNLNHGMNVGASVLLPHRETCPMYPDYEELYTFTNAASFVSFLIETYGKEKYWQVHWDVDLFESVYGLTLREMIEEWKEFLLEASAQFQVAVHNQDL